MVTPEIHLLHFNGKHLQPFAWHLGIMGFRNMPITEKKGQWYLMQ